jgi:hypothetical protein
MGYNDTPTNHSKGPNVNLLIKNALTSILGALIMGAGGMYQSKRNARNNDESLADKRAAAFAEMTDYWATLTDDSSEEDFNRYHALQHKYLNCL